jgi:hypothetical protein
LEGPDDIISLLEGTKAQAQPILAEVQQLGANFTDFVARPPQKRWNSLRKISAPWTSLSITSSMNWSSAFRILSTLFGSLPYEFDGIVEIRQFDAYEAVQFLNEGVTS